MRVVIWVTLMVARDAHPYLEAGYGVWCFWLLVASRG